MNKGIKEALSRLSEQEYRDALADFREIGHILEERQVLDLAERVLDHVRQMTSQTLLEGMPPTNVLRDLDLFLRNQKINFAIIGGIAVGVHGIPRGTADIVTVFSESKPDMTEIAKILTTNENTLLAKIVNSL